MFGRSDGCAGSESHCQAWETDAKVPSEIPIPRTCIWGRTTPDTRTGWDLADWKAGLKKSTWGKSQKVHHEPAMCPCGKEPTASWAASRQQVKWGDPSPLLSPGETHLDVGSSAGLSSKRQTGVCTTANSGKGHKVGYRLGLSISWKEAGRSRTVQHGPEKIFWNHIHVYKYPMARIKKTEPDTSCWWQNKKQWQQNWKPENII